MKKIIILITGQESRLELSSKIKYLIAPLSEKYHVGVVLSLSRTNYFTNKHKYEGDFCNNCDIKKELNMVRYNENNIVYPKLKVNYRLVSMYDSQAKSKEFNYNRGKNHARQFYTLRQSWPIIEELNPDILIRIRDDAMLSAPLNITEYAFHDLSCLNKCIVTATDNTWGGINDKFAIVSKKAIETYLCQPFKIYNSNKNDYDRSIHNPETFLKYVYSNSGITLLVTNITIRIEGPTDKFKNV